MSATKGSLRMRAALTLSAGQMMGKRFGSLYIRYWHRKMKIKKIIVTFAIASFLFGCGVAGETFPAPSTMKCLKAAKSNSKTTRQEAVNECMWTKAHDMKD